MPVQPIVYTKSVRTKVYWSARHSLSLKILKTSKTVISITKVIELLIPPNRVTLKRNRNRFAGSYHRIIAIYVIAERIKRLYLFKIRYIIQ